MAFSAGMPAADLVACKVPRFHDRSGHIVFEVKLSSRGEEWTLLKRFSEFESLNKRMKKQLPAIMANVRFPPKKWKPDARFLAQRRLDLETYLRLVIEMTYKHPQSPFFQTSKRELQKKLPFFRDSEDGII
jgi:hypothetical protein